MFSLLPKTLSIYQSRFNGEVKVVEQFGQRKIYAGGLLQSGSIIKDLWQKPLKSVDLHHDASPQILILGFGGGTVAQLLLDKFPNSHIKGIEIDPVMIKIYKEHFSCPVRVEDLRPLQLIQADCFHWIQNCEQKYDLILIDLYQGHDIPQQLYKKEFIRNIKTSLGPKGQLLLNHLFFDDYKKRIPELIKTLETQFSDIRLIRNLSNIFLLAKY